VIIVGVGAGLSYSGLGSTHHATEDIGVLRSIPNLNIVVPADAYELKSLLKQIIKSKKPTYLRIGKRGERKIYNKVPKTKIGSFNTLIKGKNICIIGCGNILINAYDAIKNLNKKKIYPELISMHTVKPLDKKNLKKIFKNYKNIVVLEEHSEIGGLASAVSEYYTENQNSNNFLKINTGTNFVIKSGNQKNAYDILNLSAKKIENKILKFLNK
jgi:Transketolase, C-terminal subunit